ncbi:MAG TPA: SDR family oxidoreductase [Ferrovibrio sp.]|uniref:NAD-dependent epimerase/dehydratase family protein n=1 Tax=Ferrovibrio sp. TaxID=1917215 RepID=UPI002ED5ED0F
MEDLVIDKAAVQPAKTGGRIERPAKILLTGADGYIGNVMAPRLVEEGFDVTGLDIGLYRAGWLFHDGRDRPRMLTRDIRSVKPGDLQGYDAIVHLAELSNDPLCENDPGLTYRINHEASVALAEAAKAAGVRRFVYASSCSVYGAAGDANPRTEESPPDPQTAYARCKVLVERDLSALADDGFSPTFLRLATAFGASPRMRFDIVLNNLAGLAWTTGRIAMTSDGTPWRPLVHISDIASAFIAALRAPRQLVHKQIFNVGVDGNNYRIREIAETAAKVFPGCEVTFGENGGDNRSYRVSFAKIREYLPDFTCRWTAERGFQQLRRIFEHVGMTEAVFNAPPYTRLRQLRQLLDTGQFDANLRWQSHEVS